MRESFREGLKTGPLTPHTIARIKLDEVDGTAQNVYKQRTFRSDHQQTPQIERAGLQFHCFKSSAGPQQERPSV